MVFVFQVNIYSAYLHDAIILYAKALNASLEKGGTIDNGTAIIKEMFGMGFYGKKIILLILHWPDLILIFFFRFVFYLTGMTGDLEIDDRGDRVTSYQVEIAIKGKFETFGIFHGPSKSYQFKNDTKAIWPGGSETAPLGRPVCGFDNEYCPPAPPGKEIVVFIRP